MRAYTYQYEHPPGNASEEQKREIALRNVARSQEADVLRVSMGLTSEQLHARVLREGGASA